jgi:hypothetical protein
MNEKINDNIINNWFAFKVIIYNYFIEISVMVNKTGLYVVSSFIITIAICKTKFLIPNFNQEVMFHTQLPTFSTKFRAFAKINF